VPKSRLFSCDRCGGKGQIIKASCPVCKGHKVLRGKNHLMVDIERGMKDGHEITFEEEADEHPDKVAGDIVFQIKTTPHPLFERKGDNLYMKDHITLVEVPFAQLSW
jgi:DnaJ-related protein SCJ1